jgi:hypothetical protein
MRRAKALCLELRTLEANFEVVTYFISKIGSITWYIPSAYNIRAFTMLIFQIDNQAFFSFACLRILDAYIPSKFAHDINHRILSSSDRPLKQVSAKTIFKLAFLFA